MNEHRVLTAATIHGVCNGGCISSPIQMAMQLAHYRKYKEIVLTYESATTRSGHTFFLHSDIQSSSLLSLSLAYYRLYYKGRTETIRPVTEKSVEFCKVYSHYNIWQ